MKEFGCRCHCEIDVGSPRWEDNPHEVLRMALHLADERIITEEEGKRQREAVWDSMSLKLSVRTRRKIERLLPLSNLFLSYREHHKYGLIRVMAVMHRVLLQIGHKLHVSDLLERVDDVFFLELEDLLWWEEGRSSGEDFKEKVERNRIAQESVTLDEFPRVIVGPECLMCFLSRQTHDSLKDLPPNIVRGIPTSPGVAEGVAVVAMDPSTTVIQRGEILIARATDPGWTPLFVSAAAVAVEIGGPLNHGSVVAKELGIPCVVGALGLMKKVRSGMRIRIDGNKGMVEILDDSCV